MTQFNQNDREDFSLFGKSFQEKFVQLLLEDRAFSDQISEVLDLNFLELKYLRVFAKKIIEYRDKTDYWKKRIEDREYKYIKFRNGYAKDAPTMLVEYLGYEDGGERYELKLGKITHIQNWEK